ncbi:FKBP-type peptidyl-prolyl cis-trans isomerase [Enterobacteriaceae bacterium LUAb1]
MLNTLRTEVEQQHVQLQALQAASSAATNIKTQDVHSSADTTDNESMQRAYASGVSLAWELQQSLAIQQSLGITLPTDQLLAGLQDVLTHQPLKLKTSEIQDITKALNTDFRSRMQIRHDDALAQGRIYRQEFSQRKGVENDAGSLYQIIDQGNSPHLHTTDLATLLISARLPDGTIFDGAGDTGQTRKVRVGSMLPAVAIGLQKVGVGGHIMIVVPPEKGYGNAGIPPAIPGGATLIFDITVKGINETG